MDDATTFIRGTIRYRGFGKVMKALHEIGITSEGKEWFQKGEVKTMRQLAVKLAEGQTETTNPDAIELINSTPWKKDEDKHLALRLANKISVIEPEIMKKIFKSWTFFELFNDEDELKHDYDNPLGALSELSLKKMSYEKGQRDMIIMRHNFTIKDKEGKIHLLTSTMAGVGDPTGQKGGHSFMAKTVGVPTALGARLILEGKVQDAGVVSPKTKQWYDPILKTLDEEHGIRLIEEWN